MKTATTGIVFVLGICLAILLTACEDGGGAPTTEPSPTAEAEQATVTPTPVPPTATPSPTGQGSATLTIGDETWTFDDLSCAFSPEETQDASVSFMASAFGESASGDRIQLVATIEDPDEEGRYEGFDVIHALTLLNVEGIGSPRWSSPAVVVSTESVTGLTIERTTTDQFIQVDGKSVSAETTMDDLLTGAFEEVPARLEGTCP